MTSPTDVRGHLQIVENEGMPAPSIAQKLDSEIHEGESVGGFITSEAYPVLGIEVRDHSILNQVTKNEPGSEPGPGTETWIDGGTSLDEDSLLKNLVDEIVQRHNRSRVLLKSKDDYEDTFRDFVNVMDLGDATLRDFKSHMKENILGYLAKKEPFSHKTRLSRLKSYVKYGLGLPWTIDTKVDVGRLPRYRKREKPKDEVVDKWLTKGDMIDDLYDRLLFHFAFEFGFRGHSHIARFRWGDTRHDVNGDPVAIVAQSKEFKTLALAVANIPPYMRKDLRQWHETTPFGSDSDPIFPWRSAYGRIEHREHNRASIADYWKRFERDFGLPYLRTGQLRHWVKTKSRQAGVNDRLSEIRSGRDPGDQYDTPPPDEILEDLEKQLPNGVLGYYRPSRIQIADAVSSEYASVCSRWDKGEIELSDLMNKMISIRQEAKSQEDKVLEP